MHGLTSDIRYALRAIRRAPVFSAVAVGCLAVAIGVNATAFSVLDAFMIRDLPGVTRQRELRTVLISHHVEQHRTSPSHLSTLDWDAFKGGIPAFSSIGVFGPTSIALRLGGTPMAVRGDVVSGSLFETLGVRPAAGRLLTTDDDRAGAPLTTVISYELWRREYGLRQDAIGQSITAGNVSFTIVGVAPEGFVGLYPGEMVADPEHGAPYLFVPVSAASLIRAESRGKSVSATLDDRWLVLVGRLRSGVSEAQAETQATSVAMGVISTYPTRRLKSFAVLRQPSTASKSETAVIATSVMSLPMLILLVACANLANQLMARAVRRGREIAVRQSLGATRGRLVRQLLVESTLLALMASVAGVFLARIFTDVMRALVLELPFRIPIDLRVLLFTTILAFVTAAVFGLVPALRGTRLDLAQAVKEGGAAGSYQRSRLRNGLVILQVAASVALVAIAGVFLRASQLRRDSGTENVDRLLTFTVDFNLLNYSTPAGLALQARAMERLAALPEVEAVALAPFGPTSSMRDARIYVVGDTAGRRGYSDLADVDGNWFAARSARPIAGRLYDPRDPAEASSAVVDRNVADRLWPDASAVGQGIRIGEGENARVATVVGVVPTVLDPRDDTPEGVIYLPARGQYFARATFYVKSRVDADAMRSTVASVLRDLDPNLPVALVATLRESLRENMASVAQLATGAGAMGVIALLLAALGIATVMSFVVEQRRYEFGVRMALGARGSTVARMFFRQALVWCATGAVVGAAIAASVTTLLRGVLFGLSPIDPGAFSASTVIIVIVALASTLGPARQAARVDPMIAIRSE